MVLMNPMDDSKWNNQVRTYPCIKRLWIVTWTTVLTSSCRTTKPLKKWIFCQAVSQNYPSGLQWMTWNFKNRFRWSGDLFDELRWMAQSLEDNQIAKKWNFWLNWPSSRPHRSPSGWYSVSKSCLFSKVWGNRYQQASSYLWIQV